MNNTARDESSRVSRAHKDECVIIIAPVAQDAVAMADLLGTEGFETQICEGLAECSRQITDSAGAILLTEEALELAQRSLFLEALRAQPPWSELPLIILTSDDESHQAGLLDLAATAAGTVTLLERPISTRTLMRSVQVALRSRRRQYQVRDLVNQLAKLNQTLEQRVAQRTAEAVERTRALHVANAELREEIARRRGLEGEILKVTDREQQRLGQELHDGLCQQLTAIGFMVQTAALRLRKHRVIDAEELEKIAQLVNNSAVDARHIARDLHKEQIEAAGFEAALRDLAERKIWSTPCRLRLETKIEINDDIVASELFRILREAITNANKHARATQITVEARRNKRHLAFIVEDNGVGLNEKVSRNKGLGFYIMKYRAKMIGARFEVDAPRKGGTRVMIRLPATPRSARSDV